MKMIKTLLKNSTNLIALTALNLVYTFAGAILFIELEECLPQGVTIGQEEVNFMRYLKGIENMTAEEHESIINVSTSFFRHASRRTCSFGQKMIVKWWEFTIVSSSTVGFGNTTPKTSLGKVAMMLYAVMGIPLAMALYAVAGELVIKFNSFVINFIESKLLKRLNVQNTKKKRTALTVTALILCILTASLLMSKKNKNLSFIDSLYFTFQTVTTIGYGDIKWQQERTIQWILFIFIFGSFAMGLIASLLSGASSTIQTLSIRKKRRNSRKRNVKEAVANESFEANQECRCNGDSHQSVDENDIQMKFTGKQKNR